MVLHSHLSLACFDLFMDVLTDFAHFVQIGGDVQCDLLGFDPVCFHVDDLHLGMLIEADGEKKRVGCAEDALLS